MRIRGHEIVPMTEATYSILQLKTNMNVFEVKKCPVFLQVSIFLQVPEIC